MSRFIFLIAIFLLSGCGIGGFWMNGDPSVGKNLKPYGAHWVKDGMTKESRRFAISRWLRYSLSISVSNCLPCKTSTTWAATSRPPTA